MFEVTIKGATMAELASSVIALAAGMGAVQDRIVNDADNTAREELQAQRSAAPKSKPARAAGKKSDGGATVSDAPEQEEEVDIGGDVAQADAELRAAIAADERTVQPMPDTAKVLVDAGTGKVAEPIVEPDAPVRMTMDDVKAAAAKLAAKDTPKLASLLKKYKAGKLSEVKGSDMGDFAADVMEALG